MRMVLAWIDDSKMFLYINCPLIPAAIWFCSLCLLLFFLIKRDNDGYDLREEK